MTWKIADAKQRFSEMVRDAAGEPQLIYNRSRLVAAVIDADEYQRFRTWSEANNRPTLADELQALRTLLNDATQADSGSPIAVPAMPATSRSSRPNAFADMLAEERG